MNSNSSSRPEALPEPLQSARPAKQALHLLIALAGWVLFVYWWWLVVQRTGREQIVWTLLFIGISLAVVVLVTVLWVVHNVRIFRRKAPRVHVGERPPARRERREGAVPLPAIRLASRDADLVIAPVVNVLVEGGKKSYRPILGDHASGTDLS